MSTIEIGIFGYDEEQFSITAQPVRGKPSTREDREEGWVLKTEDDPRGGTYCLTLKDCLRVAKSLDGVVIDPAAEEKAGAEWEDLKKSYLFPITGSKAGVIRDEENNLLIMRWGWMKGIPFVTTSAEIFPSDIGREEILSFEEINPDEVAARLLNPDQFTPINYFHTYKVWTACTEVEVTVCTGPTSVSPSESALQALNEAYEIEGEGHGYAQALEAFLDAKEDESLALVEKEIEGEEG